ncbi:MAG: aldo/keto reductase [Acidaminobacteraceae bacterium]
MEYRKLGKTGITNSIIGLGTMRLPVVDGEEKNIDKKEAIELIRHAIDNGINYIDTAYPYHGGTSEALVGEALKDGYREKVTLATKMPSWLITDYSDFDKYLDEQLRNLQTDVIDVYLLHTLNRAFWENLKKHRVFDFIEEAKIKGKIKNIGFSFHDEKSVFDDIIRAYDWDLCMIQLNYMDENHQATLDGLKLAGELEIPAIIMEPLKGGLLVNPPESIQRIWDESLVKRDPIHWSFKWIANRPEVVTILSGMGSKEQIDRNITYVNDLEVNSLTDQEEYLYKRVKHAYDDRIKVSCTDCKYCMPCPEGVNIPGNFKLINDVFIYENVDSSRRIYNNFYKNEARASSCISCRVCETKCPQSIEISEELKKVHEILG